MIAEEHLETWQTIGQQQLTNLTTFAREHRTLLQVAGIVAVAATAGMVASVVTTKGLLAVKGSVALPSALAVHGSTTVPTSLTTSAAALGQAATLAKDAVTTGAATLQNANALISGVATSGAAMSSQVTALLHTISGNILPLTAGAAGGGAVGVGVMQNQVRAVKERLQEQVAQATAYQAEAARLQQALIDALTPATVATVPEPTKPSTPDALEQIRGIGPVFARHLNAAGIFTFADLAAQTPEQLRAIMASARANRMFNPEAWIDEARQRSTPSEQPPAASSPEQGTEDAD